ncbi:hypothetical protein [Methylobacterium marchantiae]|uniref:Uncharacterized protein n=1 Tax=Methylobacterium marchantiae TaxID=600331 RepID=A0ABW3WSL7_9HYPH|nr:hypothetical protein AIGOOFII_0391 [Methylobacterium marchantiae]
MARTGTDDRPETARTGPEGDREAARTLVVIEGSDPVGRKAAIAYGRPRAEFLTQLLISSDPAMRASRAERMRSATAHYGETTRAGPSRRRA